MISLTFGYFHVGCHLWIFVFKRTVARSHCNARRDQDNLSKLLTALSAIAAPSTGTLKNLCTFLVRVLALGAAMAENAVSNFDRLS